MEKYKRIFIYLFLVYLILGLTGCAGHRRYSINQDGPPDFKIDMSKVHDAVPKIEPKSKYGNPRSYVANGRRYYVMNSATSRYRERGMVSWYGIKFHKHRTSSGEMYDLATMTAAHKTLPLPTYVQVTNLQNGRHIIVKVNDRGPFKGNRIMDLSYVAAKKLGITGTALAEINVIDPAHFRSVPITSSTITHSSPIQSSPYLFLQIGAFSNKENATVLMKQVKRWTQFPVFIKATQLNPKIVYCVRVGPIASIDQSNALYTHLKSVGLGTPIVKTELPA